MLGDPRLALTWLANEVAACRRCNGERGHEAPAAWLEECERRGWTPDRARVVRVLRELRAAIGLRGGQRRARPYLTHQLRRLGQVGGTRSGYSTPRTGGISFLSRPNTPSRLARKLLNADST